MKCSRRILVLILLLLFSVDRESLAYIPDFKMILSRTAENHGHGIYRIEQEVTFQEGNETLMTRELWYVKDSKHLRLEVRGKNKLEGNFRGTYVYNGSHRYFIDTNGVRKTSRPGADWFEPYFYFRFQKNIRPRMLTEKMIPPDALDGNSSTAADLAKRRSSQQSFLRLSRVGGVITYGIGIPTPPGESSPLPGLWIEQDLFNVRKIRFLSQAVVIGDEYSTFARRFNLPTRQTIRWDNQSIQIKVISVKALPPSGGSDSLFDPEKLDFGKNPQIAVKFSEPSSLAQFYTRFR